MKIVFAIHTPGQEYMWHHPIQKLKERNIEILVLARDDSSICNLLNKQNIQFDTYGKVNKTKIQKILQLPIHFSKFFTDVRRFQPDLIVGAGVLEAYSAFLLHKPCVIFEDSEPTPSLERYQWKHLANVILTPECFQLDLGKNQTRFAGYKELGYLHPNYFLPDPTIYKELQIKRDEKYVILRFNIFNAVHDIGRQGFSTVDKIRLVTELEKYCRVFISPEGPLPGELASRRLPVSFDRIHHALYFAQMLIGDTGTMTTEAAILGTPAIVCLSNVEKFGNFLELEHKYGLIHAFRQSEAAISKSLELIQQPDLKRRWAEKRQKLWPIN